MPKVSEITNCQFICEKLDDFLYYGHTVEHRWILQINLSVLLGVIMHVQALPKCCETTNHQCFGKELSGCAIFLYAVRQLWKLKVPGHVQIILN